MRRRLLNLLRVLSLLLCVVVVALCVRSYGGTDRLELLERTSGWGELALAYPPGKADAARIGCPAKQNIGVAFSLPYTGV